MTYLLSLGGSLINSGKIEIDFLKRFRRLLIVELKRSNRFFIVTGGGILTRQYQAVAKKLAKITDVDLDWLGIAPTRVNAELVRVMFGRLAAPQVLSNPIKRTKKFGKINLFSGWKPGRSTDYVAVRLAQTYKVRMVINLTNIDYVYDRDPKKHKNARKFEHLSWAQYRKLVGKSWKPGANYPFDPIAARFAQKLALKVVVMNGRKLNNLKNFLQGKPFHGTVLS